MEEWARRQLAREDYQRDYRLMQFRVEKERRRRFREKHPLLAWFMWGRDA